MTSRLLHTLALLLQLLLLLTPAADAAYYSYYYSYYSYYYYYPNTFSCSIGCIVGAVIGGLVFVGSMISLIVFFCFCCKAAKTRRVVPNQSVAMSVSATSGRSPNATNGSYPMQSQSQQPQPPPYDQNQMYPPANTAYPPAYPPQVAQPGSAAPAYPKPDDTAYPPPPAYSSAGQQ